MEGNDFELESPPTEIERFVRGSGVRKKTLLAAKPKTATEYCRPARPGTAWCFAYRRGQSKDEEGRISRHELEENIWQTKW
jgi:hypothetical protein